MFTDKFFNDLHYEDVPLPTFTAIELARIIEYAEHIDDEKMVNKIAEMIINDLEEDLRDPAHIETKTRIFYRDYFDVLSRYKKIDADLLEKLENLTFEDPNGAYRGGTCVNFNGILTLEGFRNGLLNALINNDSELANWLCETVIADTEADILDFYEKAIRHYRRYYEVAKAFSIVSDELIDRWGSLLKSSAGA